MRKPVDLEIIREMIQLNETLSLSEIGKRYGITKQAVIKRFKKVGYKSKNHRFYESIGAYGTVIIRVPKVWKQAIEQNASGGNMSKLVRDCLREGLELRGILPKK